MALKYTGQIKLATTSNSNVMAGPGLARLERLREFPGSPAAQDMLVPADIADANPLRLQFVRRSRLGRAGRSPYCRQVGVA